MVENDIVEALVKSYQQLHTLDDIRQLCCRSLLHLYSIGDDMSFYMHSFYCDIYTGFYICVLRTECVCFRFLKLCID